jgi:hypothetical protein
MRRTVFSAMALACTAVLAGAVPAFADGEPPTAAPTPTAQGRVASPTPTAVKGGVAVVPKGAPDTGVVPPAQGSGVDGGLIGGAAAAVFAVGGTAVFVVRRRRSAQA